MPAPPEGSPPGSRATALSPAHALVLGTIVLASAALRFHALGRESIWIDEALSIRLARLPWGDLVEGTSVDGHPPLYVGLLHFWMLVFGSSEAAVRSLSALLGTAAVPLMFVAGRRLVGPFAALLGTALFACSSYHIYYSQEARNYALLVFLTLLATAAYARWDERPGRRHAVAYVASATLLLYTHVYALLVAVVHVLHFLWRLWSLPGHARGGRLRAGLAVAVPAAVLLVPWVFAPWTALLVRQVDPTTTTLQVARPGLALVGISFVQFAGSLPLFVALAPLSALGLWRTWRERRSTAILLGLWLTLPHAVPFVVSQVSVPIYLTRSTIVTLPAFLLLAAAAVARWRPPLAVGTSVLLSILALHGQWGYFQVTSKEQWREAAAVVEHRAQPGDVVAFDVGYGEGGFDHYAQRSDLSHVHVSADVRELRGGAELASAAHRATSVWLVRFHRPDDPDGVVRATSPWGRLLGQHHLVGIQLYRVEALRRGP